jgi:VWFA-related protein
MDRRSLVTLALVAAVGATGGAQQAPQRANPSEPTTVSAILVDVVVRDRKGMPVAGLTAEDFEITEDGVPQTLGSMTPIFKDTPAATGGTEVPPPQASRTEVPRPQASRGDAPAAPAAAAAPAAQEVPEVIALVFDRLTSDGRATAHTASMKYLSALDSTRHYMGVFAIDINLMPLQTFTRDVALVRKAVDEFAKHASSQYGSYAEARRDAGKLEAANNALNAAQAASGGGPGGTGEGMSGAAVQQAMAQSQNQMAQTFDALERDQAGYSSANALMAVVNGMRNIPGRKSIVFFSEGLSIPPNVQERFLSVIASANRANVSIYPMDAMGLRTESSTGATRDEMLAQAKQNLGRNPSRDSNTAMMAAMERNEDLLRMDPHAGLGQLAEETGGFLIANTNDLRAGFQRIETDMRNYYMLTYVPSNDTFDGKFRQIGVRVKRPGVSVHSRRGYFAVRDTAGIPISSHEAPALAALDRTPVPNAFPVFASALKFPERLRPHLLPLIVEVSTAGLTFVPADDKQTYRSDFTVLVRFKDASGKVIDKLSQHYQVTGPIESIEKAKQGQVIFYRQPEIPPGTYTMETVVYDAIAQKASVRFKTVEQAAAAPDTLRLSSLMLVSRGERVPADQRPADNPLFVGEMLLYPNLGAPLRKGTDQELAFFFTAYPGGGTATGLGGTIELLQDAKVVARAPMTLEKPDEQGRIQQVSRLPIEALMPGRYQLRVLLQQGGTTVAGTTEFRIVG